MNRKPNLEKLLVGLAAIFRREITDDLLDAYQLALAEYDEDDLCRVGIDLMKGSYFPIPSDFIRAVVGDEAGLDQLANLRWNEIVGWMANRNNFPDDKKAEQIITMMGDKFMFRQMTPKQIEGMGFSFRKSYVALAVIDDADNRRIESENRAMIEETVKRLEM